MQEGDFLDTNVLVYLVSNDLQKANQTEILLHKHPTISVQVLNEFANVCTRKKKMSIEEIVHFEQMIAAWCTIRPFQHEHHVLALSVMQRHQLSFYDSLIIASALEANCRTLFSEDMQHGLKIARQLVIKNPFINLVK